MIGPTASTWCHRIKYSFSRSRYKSRVDGDHPGAPSRAPKQDLSSATGNAPRHARISCLGEVESDPLRPLIRKACVTLSHVTTSVGGAPTLPVLYPRWLPSPLRCVRVFHYFSPCAPVCFVLCHLCTCLIVSRPPLLVLSACLSAWAQPHLFCSARPHPSCPCLPLLSPVLVRQLCAPVMSCASS